MCSRSDIEHLLPEAPGELWCNECAEVSAVERDGTGYCAGHDPRGRAAQLDERQRQVLAGALEDHRRAGL